MVAAQHADFFIPLDELLLFFIARNDQRQELTLVLTVNILGLDTQAVQGVAHAGADQNTGIEIEAQRTSRQGSEFTFIQRQGHDCPRR